MDSGHDFNRMVVEDDRLSSLPDDLIRKILSFIGIKDAIKTSGLSSRWRYIWTSLPCHNLRNDDIVTLFNSYKFDCDVLPHRNHQIYVSSINLNFAHGPNSLAFFTTVVRHILSSSTVRQLTLEGFSKGNHRSGPVCCYLGSTSLQALTLRGCILRHRVAPDSAWELLALTTLRLDDVVFYNNDPKSIGVLSKCVNLQHLTLNHCKVWGSQDFHICLPRLSGLVIKQIDGELFKDGCSLHFSADTLHSVKKMDLCIQSPHIKTDASKIFGILQHLNSLMFLTINLELLEFLSSSIEEVSSLPPFPFANLKLLLIYPFVDIHHKQLPLSANKIKNYFLHGSAASACCFLLVPRENETRHRSLMPTQLRRWRARLNSRLENVSVRIELVKAKIWRTLF